MKKAFTLIELLVVIAIIGILTAIVLAQFNVAKAKSRDAKRVTDIAQIQLAIQLYFDRCGQYPRAKTAAGASFPTGPDSIVDLDSNVGACPSGITLGTFISQLPKPPTFGGSDTSYNYRYIVHTANTINDDYYLAARLEQPSRALDDDVDGMVPTSISGWSGWTASGNTFAAFSFDDNSPNYIYGVSSK